MTSPAGGLSAYARVSQLFPTALYGGFRGPVDDPKRPAGEHHERSGRPQPALQREAMFCQFLKRLRKPSEAQKGRASSPSAGFGAGGVRGLAPGFYLRCPPVARGRSPRIDERDSENPVSC